MTERDEVVDVAIRVRTFLEDEWAGWRSERYIRQPEVNSYSMCRMSAAFLRDRLMEELGGQWAVTGGAGAEGWDLGDCLRGAEPGGMVTTAGIWAGHWWVTGNGLIVDVTADQFGHDDVIVTEISDPRYRGNYTKLAKDKYLSRVTKTVSSWSERWPDRRAAWLPGAP